MADTFEGKPCIHGHGTTRLTCNRQCVTCSREGSRRWAAENGREYHAKWRDEHPDLVRAAQARYYWADPERRRLKTRRQYAEHADQRRTYSRKYASANPERARRHASVRRTRISAGGGTFTVEQADIILAAQAGCCAYCGVENDLQIDHMVPVSRGGSSWPWNLQWLCKTCNLAKRDSTDHEYRERSGISAAEPIFMGILRAILLM